MDTLDNANSNPFAINNSNSDLILQKEGLMLDLAKQNGDPTTNGKRSADEEFDDDDDLGPETDVDAIDDVLMSPISNKHLDNNIEAEKATLETEHVKNDPVKLPSREEASTPPADLVHDTSGLVDNVAESCEDSEDEWNYYKGDIADKENIAPSETDKEVCDIIDNDEMSHLNPNAAEFVPLSPKARTDSPTLQALIDEPLIARSPKRGTAQHNADINVPNLNEFECEIKSRPSDVHKVSDKLEHNLSSEDILVNLLNGKNIEEIEEFRPFNTPIKTFKPDEFHFGPNATAFSTPGKFDMSEALSTKAVFGDESSASYLEHSFAGDMSKSQVMSKEQDPMSASLYLDKDDADDSNSCDLNKVHVLPDNIELFLEKSVEQPFLNDTISDLPEHDPAIVVSNKQSELKIQVQNELLDEFQSQLLPQEISKSSVDKKVIEFTEEHAAIISNSPPLSPTLPLSSQFGVSQISPVAPHSSVDEESNFTLESFVSIQSPVPLQAESPISPRSPIHSHSPVNVQSFSPPLSPNPAELNVLVHVPMESSPLAQSPIAPQLYIPEQLPITTESYLFTTPISSDSYVTQVSSPIESVLTQFLASEKSVYTHSPLFPQSPILPEASSPVQSPTTTQSPAFVQPFISSSPISPWSPVGVLTAVDRISVQVDEDYQNELSEVVNYAKEESNELQPPENSVFLQSQVPLNESYMTAEYSPIVVDTPILLDDTFKDNTDIITSPSPSPVPSHQIESPVDDITSSVKDSPLLSSPPLENKVDNNTFEGAVVFHEMNSLILNDTPLSPQSKIETESVATTDVNSFLERSLLPDIESPLSLTEQEDTVVVPPTVMASDVQLPLQDIEITSDVIAPQFPVQQELITTPTEAVIKSIAQKKTPATAKPKVGVTSAATTSVSKKPAPKTATTPTKPTAKPLAKPSPATTKPAPAKSMQAKTSTTPFSSPKPSIKSFTKAPVTNGVAKVPIASAITKTTSTSLSAKPVASKTTKLTATRPATAPPGVPKQSASPASRPATLTNKTSSTTTTAVKKPTVTSTVTNAKSTVKSAVATSPKEPAKPRPTTAPIAARPKSTSSKPLTKAPDTEKSIKEAVNKQTASRTVATTIKTTVRKVEPKVTTTRTSATKTTPTSLKGLGDYKKPQELIRHPTTKTKITKETKKETKVHENGLENEITVTSTTTIEEAQLIMKDVSPLIENSQLLD